MFAFRDIGEPVPRSATACVPTTYAMLPRKIWEAIINKKVGLGRKIGKKSELCRDRTWIVGVYGSRRPERIQKALGDSLSGYVDEERSVLLEPVNGPRCTLVRGSESSPLQRAHERRP